MSIEMRASANQKTGQVARQVAQAGLQYLVQILYNESRNDFDHQNSLWYTMGHRYPGCDLVSSPVSTPFCLKLYDGVDVEGGATFHQHQYTYGGHTYQADGPVIEDEAGKFNLNAMGYLGDAGSERNFTQRYSAFEASLARLIAHRFHEKNVTFGATDLHYTVAAFLANRIVRHRYGPDKIPGAPGTRPLEQRPAACLPYTGNSAWTDGSGVTQNWSDTGIQFPTPNTSWRQMGLGINSLGDGYATTFIRENTGVSWAEPGVWRSWVSGTDWGHDTGAACFDTTLKLYPSSAAPLGANDMIPNSVRAPDGNLYAEFGLVPTTLLEKGTAGFPADALPYARYVPDDAYNADPDHDGTGGSLDADANDDRTYKSVAEIVPIIAQCIHELAIGASSQPLTQVQVSTETANNLASDADSRAKATKMLYDVLKDHLTVHSSAWDDLSVNINPDWSGDGYDNDGDGRIDDSNELNWNASGLIDDQRRARLVALRRGLGLVARDTSGNWAVQHGLTLRQANQIVANIVDFADGAAQNANGAVVLNDHVRNIPTKFDADINGNKIKITDNATNCTDIAYGAEGIHVTEIMGTPPELTSNDGSEMTNDGGTGGSDVTGLPDTDDPRDGGAIAYTDGNGFDWTPDNTITPWKGYWRIAEDVLDSDPPIVAKIEYPQMAGVPYKKGWYAIRVYAREKTGAGSATTIGIAIQESTPAAGDYTAITLPTGGGWVYPRVSGKLKEFLVTNTDKITVWLRVTVANSSGSGNGARIYGIQLLPQFIELTNCAMQSPLLWGQSHNISLSGLTLRFATGDGTTEQAINLFDGANARYYDSGPVTDATWIPAARPDGAFPVNYGFFVVAASERAYDFNFGNRSGTWGDHFMEAYPVYFPGDINDTRMSEFVPGLVGAYAKLRDASGNLWAGGEVDFRPAANGNLVGLTLTPYVSHEKNTIISPVDLGAAWWTSASYGYDNTNPAARTASTDHIQASQNVLLTVPADAIRGVAASYTIYSCLNAACASLWNTYPTFKTCSALVNDSVTLPIILNAPYPSPGWLGLVPSGTPWRTIDPDTTPTDNPSGTHELLGRLLKHATVAACFAKINLNTASNAALAAAMDGDATIGSINMVTAVMGTPRALESWDTFLSSATGYDNAGAYDRSAWNRFWQNRRISVSSPYAEDSGAGTFGDDFPDDSDEKEEWIRRYSNLLTLRSNAFRCVVDGLVFAKGKYDTPISRARLEAVIKRGPDLDQSGLPKVRVVEMRFIE